MIPNYKKQHKLGIAGLALMRNLLVGKNKTILSILNVVTKISKTENNVSENNNGKAVKYAVAEGYKKWAGTYDTSDNLLIEIEEPALKSILKQFKPCLVLDAGCGTGRYSRFLQSIGHKVTGVDISPEMLEQAKKRTDKVNFLQADLNSLPLNTESFDLAVCALVLTHFPNITKIIKELSRVTHAGGHIIISDIHPLFVELGAHAKFSDNMGRKGFVTNHIHWHSTYIDIFNKTGLKIIQCYDQKVTSKHIKLAKQGLDLSRNTVSQAFEGLPVAIIWVLEKI